MNQARLNELLDGLCTNALSADELAELDAQITRDPDVAKQVARMCDLSRELSDCLRPSSQLLPILEQPLNQRPTRVGRISTRRVTMRKGRDSSLAAGPRLFAIVTAIAAIIAVVVLVTRPVPRERWLEGQAEFAHGGHLTSGQVLPSQQTILATGTATLCYADGTRVRLASGTRVTLGDGPGKQLVIDSGLLHARVAKQPSGAPFLITTPHAQMTVVGTVFTITTLGSQTELAVDEGAVRLRADGIDTLVSGGQHRVVGEPTPPPVAVAARPAEYPERLILRNAVWAYRDEGEEPEFAWRQPGFDDRQWRRGPAPLGYDRNEERAVFTTHIRSDNHAQITAWFRHEFTCDDPSQVTRLVIHLQRDDGAVIYLNGEEVVRDNMPSGAITAKTLAEHTVEKDHQEESFVWTVPTRFLRTGKNCIAAEVHQYKDTSTDLLFSLELHAEYRPTGGTRP